MNPQDALQRLAEIIRRKHLALSTEQSYCGWLRRYCDFVKKFPARLSSEHKLERFLTPLANQNVAASTQNQAFNALIFFYQHVLGVELKGVQAMRARTAAQVRRAPTREETLRLIQAVQGQADFATGLAIRLLYGCSLRVTEPLNLRIKDVNIAAGQLIIRAVKGGKARVVSMPCSVMANLGSQLESARVIRKRDQSDRVPVALPGRLATKSPQAQYEWNWAWLFPANHPCLEPRTDKRVRWRLHEANVQRVVRKACRTTGLSILPHELRHAYATHCLNSGANPRAIQ